MKIKNKQETMKGSLENIKKLLEKRNLVLVEGGKFDMGSEGLGSMDEKPIHRVILDNFYISKYLVTQRLWKEIMGYNYSDFEGDDRPVQRVNWYNAIKFCNALSKKDNFKPCYYIHGNSDFQDYLEHDLEILECDFSANGYRLPTEAEWEYAARGGKKSMDYRYSGSNTIEEVAWFYNNSDGETHPVGRKRANELGIYDMSGNLKEWCWNGFAYYEDKPLNNPKGPFIDLHRITRGGGLHSLSFDCRVVDRDIGIPDNNYRTVGFRFAKNH
ncbi:MAG: SUMF1/EgtB/PvdO family nonheme iron enzyme [Candidatus Cloacimonetes bacterium]|nr:SUMF1/EgtB/PvdO family nonheme iron enzyme [Candidatus Cloacimonadota bacterium]